MIVLLSNSTELVERSISLGCFNKKLPNGQATILEISEKEGSKPSPLLGARREYKRKQSHCVKHSLLPKFESKNL